MRPLGKSVSLRTLAVVCLLLPLAGCALFDSKQNRAMRRLPEYREGYNDGCISAQEPDANMRDPAPARRDEQMYDGNRAYRYGWNTGCGAGRSVPGTSAAPSLA